MMRAGGLRGTMQQCIGELWESDLPADFKLSQTRSLLRYLREVKLLVSHIKSESGFECDTTAYLDILCAKEESNLLRRVSDTRILKQDFDEKRREWRKKKKNVINAISEMNARALKFECNEKKTIALYAIQYYKNVMANDDGAIPGESESTDGLIEQYRRHRDEISKIPMYADSIMRMLKDIRKTVHASAKLQPGTNAFTQFLDEWWASVVNFLQHSSIVDAEKNAREVMQTLKKLKGKQEENKKKEMNRLLSKLEAQDNSTPPITPASEPFEILDDSLNPEDTGRWNDLERSRKPHAVNKARRRAREGGSMHEHEEQSSGFREAGNDTVETGGDLIWSGRNTDDRGVGSPLMTVTGACGGLKNLTDVTALPLNLGNLSVTSWDGASERTLGTDAGTDPDLIATSGIPEGESDDDEDDDEFEVADSRDLGAVNLCEAGTGADGFTTYEDTASQPYAMRHMTQKLGVEQKRFSAALDYFRQEQQFRGRRGAIMPPPPPPAGSWRSKMSTTRGRGTISRGKGRGRRLSSGGQGRTDSVGTKPGSAHLSRAHSLYLPSTSSMHGSVSGKKRVPGVTHVQAGSRSRILPACNET